MAEQLGFHQRGRERGDVDGKNDTASSANVNRASSNGTYRDWAMARAASSLPVPEGPVISVANSPMRAYRVRR